MRLSEKLRTREKSRLWQEYCGFLDLSIDEYMYIQNRLMEEQMKIWCACGIGQKLLSGAVPGNIEEFRSMLPLTTYKDYADILLARREDMLPDKPIVWIQTTWEGGVRPIKLAPYTRGMLDVYKHNAVSIMMLAGARKKGDVNIKDGDTVLYGGAPLPFATGLLPSLLDEELRMGWLPDANRNSKLSFGDRIKKGFEMALKEDIDYLFGIGSVTNYITSMFGRPGGTGRAASKASLKIAFRYLKTKYICKRDKREVRPGDIFKIKGFVSTGTDAKCYRERLARAWGRMPIEIAAGTESTCIGTEDYDCNGMTFFPDACFYEFIPENEYRIGLADEEYVPKTCLMSEVREGESYELVISVLKGGAFARYRIGDVYRCVKGCRNGALPRFVFVDRAPNIIDIAGFTRISRTSIEEVIETSRLSVGNWFARKEYSENNSPFLHIYIEIPPDSALENVVTVSVLREHLEVYFKNFDSDYEDLKKLLDMDPLRLSVLKFGTLERYEKEMGRSLPKINPSDVDVRSILRLDGGALSRGFAEEVSRK